MISERPTFAPARARLRSLAHGWDSPDNISVSRVMHTFPPSYPLFSCRLGLALHSTLHTFAIRCSIPRYICSRRIYLIVSAFCPRLVSLTDVHGLHPSCLPSTTPFLRSTSSSPHLYSSLDPHRARTARPSVHRLCRTNDFTTLRVSRECLRLYVVSKVALARLYIPRVPQLAYTRSLTYCLYPHGCVLPGRFSVLTPDSSTGYGRDVSTREEG